jgi:hypothetical protein
VASKPKRKRKGFDQGGLFDPPQMQDGTYQGQKLSSDSLGKGIMGGASAMAGAAGAAGAAAMRKGGKVRKVLRRGK